MNVMHNFESESIQESKEEQFRTDEESNTNQEEAKQINDDLFADSDVESVFQDDYLENEGDYDPDSFYKTNDKKKSIDAYLSTIENSESLPLLEGENLYRIVTVERIIELYPRLEVDLRKHFTSLSFGGTTLDERYLTAFLRLFARSQFDEFDFQLKQCGIEKWNNRSVYLFSRTVTKIDYYCLNNVMRIASYLEEFRKFFLTSKQIKKPSELKDGDILYNGRIVVDRGYHDKYEFRSDINPICSFESGPRCEYIRWPEFVIGTSNGINIEKVITKCIDISKGKSLEEWMIVLRDINNRFPAHSCERGEDEALSGIGTLIQPQVDRNYIEWLLDNKLEVKRYFISNKKRSDTMRMLSELSSKMREKVLKKVIESLRWIELQPVYQRSYWREHLYNSSGFEWLGEHYHFPEFSTYLGSPIRNFLIHSNENQLDQFDWPVKKAKASTLRHIIVPDLVDEDNLQDGETITYEQGSLF
ncbi:hypothetical protein POF51_25890 [Brevibacillus sp. AG]|uniref:hypothetical protein n=1 Tax=Brevibacillus sp. AG TaxID=3020891 RepID=UPI00232B1D2C|nr:hypothetical protein [Brevibacillus sp. AG]MDC0764155.1 hypothetical protein [Brevibacillus sp. AG]